MKTEKQTRKEIIDKKLEKAGWNINDRTQVIEEFDIQMGLAEGVRGPPAPYQDHQFSDCVLLDPDRPFFQSGHKKDSRAGAPMLRMEP